MRSLNFAARHEEKAKCLGGQIEYTRVSAMRFAGRETRGDGAKCASRGDLSAAAPLHGELLLAAARPLDYPLDEAARRGAKIISAPSGFCAA